VKTSTAVTLAIILLLLGFAFGALSSPVKQYVYTTLILGETFKTTSTTTTTIIHTVFVSTSVPGGRVEKVCFSAVEDCSSLIVFWISRANKSIHVMIYSFTQDEIGEALAQAVKRGIDVEIVFEESQLSKYSELERLKEAGAEVYLDGNPYTMHHKVAVIDGVVVITGSYNWSKSAEERNDENLVILLGENVAKLYESEFQRVKSEAVAA